MVDKDENLLDLDSEIDLSSNPLVEDIVSENIGIKAKDTSKRDSDNFKKVSTDKKRSSSNSYTKSKSQKSNEGLTLNEAIDDIISTDADSLINAEDKERLGEGIALSLSSIKENKLLGFIKSLWLNPVKRRVIIFSLFITAVAVFLFPGSRYYLLNAAGIRASASVLVKDSATLQPLKNVTVHIGGVKTTTNSEGEAILKGIKLGATNMSIKRRAFASLDKKITIGLGSNPLGEYSIEPVGSQYVFYVKDFLSGQSIKKAEATLGDSSALSDDEGKIVLVEDTVNMNDDDILSISISKEGYRVENIDIQVSNKESQAVTMVTSRPHIFVSKRSGKYDIYRIDLDGKNEQKILEGSGFEKDNMTLISHPTKNIVIYVASRENIRNPSGYLLDTAYIINLEREYDVSKFDQSEKIRIIGWSSSGRLVYVKIAAGESGTSPKRHRLVSIDPTNTSNSNKEIELASSNYFNDVSIVGDTVLYAKSNIFNEDSSPGLHAVKANGKDELILTNHEVYSFVRLSYESIYMETADGWQEYDIRSSKVSRAHAPGVRKSRFYIDSVKDKGSLWLDERDGKDILLRYDTNKKEDDALVEQNGMSYPIVWFDGDNIIYRISNSREVADYTYNLTQKKSIKIVDVTNALGINSWYY